MAWSATGKTVATYGEHPSGYAYYTRGGHFLIFAVTEGRKKNEKIAAPTDAESIELFKSMFAWGGIYKIEGNKIIFDVDNLGCSRGSAPLEPIKWKWRAIS